MTSEKKRSRPAVMVLALAFVVVMSPLPAIAQLADGEDCGNRCRTCGFLWLYHEGRGHDPDGTNNMDCRFLDCLTCIGAPTSVSDVQATESAVLDSIRRADSRALHALARKYAGRLILNESRNLLAMRGFGCRAEQITAVIFLGANTTAALKRLNVLELTGAETMATKPRGPAN